MHLIRAIILLVLLNGSAVAAEPLHCSVDAGKVLHPIDHRIFGSNLEWFNDAGGLAVKDSEFVTRLEMLAKDEGITVQRFPGGVLSDYYDWHQGTGPQDKRKVTPHPTDPGKSRNSFGSPEYFRFLRVTGAQGLITVNAGTGTARLAADWVHYANDPVNAARRADGIEGPADIKLWEVGNELYLPGNPGEKKITVSPSVYADRFLKFAAAMRKADPSIELFALGVANSHVGPKSEFDNWTDIVLSKAAPEIDYIAVHNAYFPLLYNKGMATPEMVYKALLASPQTVARSLDRLEKQLAYYEKERKIGIAITEWGMLFSLPGFDDSWFDHVKTMGSGVYVGRILQVFMSHPRVKIANYFKFVDRFFMGWVNYLGEPKVPYWVFKLYAKHTGKMEVESSIEDSPLFSTPPVGGVPALFNIPEVTVFASTGNGRLYINLINRSLYQQHDIALDIRNFTMSTGTLYSVSAHGCTDHNGRDIPPEWAYRKEMEPVTTVRPASIQLVHKSWKIGEVINLPPCSVATVEMEK